MAEELMVEGISEIAEGAVKIARSFTTPQVLMIAGGVAIGVGVTAYFIGKKRAQAEADTRLEKELVKFREYYQKMAEKPSPSAVVEERGYVEEAVIVDTPDDLPKVPYNHMYDEKEAPNQVVSRDGQDVWDYSLEVKARIANPELPYVIHFDEFENNEPDHEQVEYTYFETDDILIDHQNNTIPGMDEIVGLGNLQLFGHGSNDANIVYVRNENLDLDIEVTRDPGSFTETVHGEIKHSARSNRAKDKRKRRDRRFDDE